MHSVMFKAPMMITCEEFESFILEYIEGDLSPRQKMIFEMHLRVCAECRAYLKEYERARALTEAQRNIESTEVPDDLIAAILAARGA
ncbi:conserved hypothetical protein [Rhodobacteraceae bacterium KLH11]|nr:conserved hypothetical protein [Rhodobacteraceae bacterium KLH11]